MFDLACLPLSISHYLSQYTSLCVCIGDHVYETCYHKRALNKVAGWGDGMAQWLERWTGDPKVEDLNPVRSTRKTLSFSESKRLC